MRGADFFVVLMTPRRRTGVTLWGKGATRVLSDASMKAEPQGILRTTADRCRKLQSVVTSHNFLKKRNCNLWLMW